MMTTAAAELQVLVLQPVMVNDKYEIGNDNIMFYTSARNYVVQKLYGEKHKT